MDTSSLGGEDHRTPAHRTPLICNEEVNFTMGVWGALATWQDAKGTRWVLTPFWGPKHTRFEAPIEHGQVVYGAVAAFKVVDDAKTGKPRSSRVDFVTYGGSPVIANGVVYAYGSGETRRSAGRAGHVGGSEGRIQESTHAVLYARRRDRRRAVVERSDQVLNHFSGLSIANGRVYIGTFDGMLYCFGAASLPFARLPRGACRRRKRLMKRQLSLAVVSASRSDVFCRHRAGAAPSGRPVATTRSERHRSRPIRESRFKRCRSLLTSGRSSSCGR
jgi:hypothetical protein